ncbi:MULTISPECIES: DUF6879 family protein [unclassified Streptomyces]|uniref:DUF6879 family protein n=1 Tax=unclassified Streptomyces TaxID=2593676 RepID=UPI002F906ABC
MTRTPAFEDLFRDCQRTAVHLEMRDAYMKSDPAFIDWKAGMTLDPAERWGDWHGIVTKATSRSVEVRRSPRATAKHSPRTTPSIMINPKIIPTGQPT